MTDRELLTAQLIKHEGFRAFPYADTGGKITIGVGRNLTDKGLSADEIQTLLDHDIDEVVTDLMTFPWFVALNPVRQRVVADMRFNLGPVGFRRFTRTLASIAAGEYEKASVQMLQSRWASQVGQRALRLAAMMRDGEPV